MKAGDLVFMKGVSIISKIIMWWTNSHWSHVAIASSPNTVIEATWPRVREVNLIDSTEGDPYQAFTPVVPLTPDETAALLTFLRSQIGRRYNLWGLFSFILHRKVGSKTYFWCSELAAAGYQKIGRMLVRRSIRWIDPETLYGSVAITEAV
jgi:uncharacterized protein YycO